MYYLHLVASEFHNHLSTNYLHPAFPWLLSRGGGRHERKGIWSKLEQLCPSYVLLSVSVSVFSCRDVIKVPRKGQEGSFHNARSRPGYIHINEALCVKDIILSSNLMRQRITHRHTWETPIWFAYNYEIGRLAGEKLPSMGHSENVGRHGREFRKRYSRLLNTGNGKWQKSRAQFCSISVLQQLYTTCSVAFGVYCQFVWPLNVVLGWHLSRNTTFHSVTQSPSHTSGWGDLQPDNT